MSRIIRLPTVREKTGKSTSSIYWMIEKGLFPQQIKLGVRSVGWIEEEVNSWIEDRIKETRQGKEA